MRRGEPGSDFRVAVVGDFQIGKSSLVNCLVAESSAEIGEGYFPTTDGVAEYPFAPGIRIVDTPGFNDAHPELTKESENAIESADVILFVKTEKTLGERDGGILRLSGGKPLLVLFNCTDKTLGRQGWALEHPINTEIYGTIEAQLAEYGFAPSMFWINGRLVTPINVLWAQFGLGQSISDEQENDVAQFARQKLGLDFPDTELRAKLLDASGFLPVRDFLINLPLELLKHVVSNPKREIDRIVDRFAEDLKKRWSAA